ncbi:putative ribonuclease H-like domain-containing protein [Tanacetum coccineum]|uniref:Ribonuclease H-like domain-containing protein n=1 Tax=Tanacetum coccineum TaxID=301880 RepID=A0ABQ4XWV4_9ASTR
MLFKLTVECRGQNFSGQRGAFVLERCERHPREYPEDMNITRRSDRAEKGSRQRSDGLLGMADHTGVRCGDIIRSWSLVRTQPRIHVLLRRQNKIGSSGWIRVSRWMSHRNGLRAQVSKNRTRLRQQLPLHGLWETMETQLRPQLVVLWKPKHISGKGLNKCRQWSYRDSSRNINTFDNTMQTQGKQLDNINDKKGDFGIDVAQGQDWQNNLIYQIMSLMMKDRCDNGGEFRNKEMDDFCSRKGIKREFSNARTPQQNKVAERRNRTLIEAAMTMFG